MEPEVWIRFLGLFLTWALSSDVSRTVQAIRVTSVRRRVKVVLVILPLLNVFSLIVELLSTRICAVMINLLAGSYYLTKIFASYLYCMRVDVLLRGPMQSQRMTNILFLVKIYLCITFALNICKALAVYKSYKAEDGTCVVDFGEGLWFVLDEIMFTISDVTTISMLVYILYSCASAMPTGPNGPNDKIKMTFLRLTRISIIPLVSTVCTTVQVIVDKKNTHFMGNFDIQVHVLCIMIAYATSHVARGRRPPQQAVSPGTLVKNSSTRISATSDDIVN